MSTVRRTIGPVAVGSAGVTSASFVVPDGLTDVWIKMTACPEWVPATGGTFSLGVEASTDGGTTWFWVAEAGFLGTPTPIGQTFRGLMPQVACSVGGLTGTRLRARAQTSGPTIHPTFQVITEP